MYLFDNEIKMEDRPILEKYLQSYEYRTSGLSFTSQYMWRKANRISWQVLGEYAFLAAFSHLENEEDPFLFPPLTSTGYYDPAKLGQSIREAKRIFASKGLPFCIRLLPEHMIPIVDDACPGEFSFLEDRPNYDYIYLSRDLADLPGRKYSPKRNHLNHFREHNEYQYGPLTSAMAAEAMVFIREFNLRKRLAGLPQNELELLHLEEVAMEDVFQNIETVGYLAGAIWIGGKIEALTLGGYLGKDTVTVHVEKANVEIRGAYQAINNEFSRQLKDRVAYINREEDMDLPGLRTAKLSYHPFQLLKKYIAVPTK